MAKKRQKQTEPSASAIAAQSAREDAAIAKIMLELLGALNAEQSNILDLQALRILAYPTDRARVHSRSRSTLASANVVQPTDDWWDLFVLPADPNCDMPQVYAVSVPPQSELGALYAFSCWAWKTYPHFDALPPLEIQLTPPLAPKFGAEGEHTAEEPAAACRQSTRMGPFCNHKFVDSNNCGKCGVHIDTLRRVDREALSSLVDQSN